MGVAPFPWQNRLNQRFMDDDWREIDALDIPTGLGKTSVMAIWLAALLAGAKNLPRRLVYIVDRRVVVDQASQEARNLAAFFGQDDQAADHKRLRKKLREHCGVDTLAVSTLRGQHVDNRDWLKNPTAPAIIVGTVDMIGSRLLFSGYGVSRGMRPVHAGMLGQDTLFVLDEAHLVPPFQALLRAASEPCSSIREDCDALLPIHLLSLSATQTKGSGSCFVLDAEDQKNLIVKKRLKAQKLLEIKAVEANAFVKETVSRVIELLKTEPAARIVLFCDKRKDAEKLKSKLPVNRIAMLTGGRRVHEREEASEQLTELGFTGERGARDDEPAILIATSAGEVGVDFDADHAVMDLVPWERMVQRLGRVNRRGDHSESRVFVLDFATAADWAKMNGADPGKVRELLGKLEKKDRFTLCNLAALGNLQAPDNEISAASTKAPLRPALAVSHRVV